MKSKPTYGQVRAELAELGAELSADAEMVTYERPRSGHHADVILVDRVSDLTEAPDYCIHGFANCVRCDAWCYLGSETHRVVINVEAVPLCLHCAPQVLPEGRQVRKRVYDHPRHADTRE